MPLLLKKRSSLLHTDLSARRIVNEVDQLSVLMQKHSQLQNGTLRIGLLWVASYLNLSHILTDYHRIYPGISYSLTVDGSNMLLQMLDSRSINAAFVISSEAALQHKEDLFFHRIMDDRYVAIVSRQNPLSGQPEPGYRICLKLYRAGPENGGLQDCSIGRCTPSYHLLRHA